MCFCFYIPTEGGGVGGRDATCRVSSGVRPQRKDLELWCDEAAPRPDPLEPPEDPAGSDQWREGGQGVRGVPLGS